MTHNNQYSDPLRHHPTYPPPYPPPYPPTYPPPYPLSPSYSTHIPPSSPNHYSPSYPQQHKHSPQQQHHTPQHHQYSPEKREERWEQRSVSSEGSEYSEEYYTKRKPINKTKNTGMDNAEQIRKWIEARKRNYPRGETAAGEQRRLQKNQMSILEMKIRKKILLVNADPRSLYKKLRNLDLLRRFIVNPRPRPKKNNQAKPAYPRSSHKYEQVESAERQQMEEDLPEQKPIRKEQTEVGYAVRESMKVVQQQMKVVREQMKVVREQMKVVREQMKVVREQMKAGTIIAHLLEKQKEDTEWMARLMDYKSNSANYRYHCQTLETSLVLQDVFRESSYMLQVIRYVVANNFLQ